MKHSLTVCMALIALFSATAVIAETDAGAEVNAIVEQLLTPATKNANDAIALAATDPVKACQLAKSADNALGDAQTRVNALNDRLVAEGRDASPLAPFKAKIAAGVPQFHQLAEGVCSGEIAKMQKDPVTRDMAANIGPRMKAYTDDMLAADEAKSKGDMVTYCRQVTDGGNQLKGLTGYLVKLRSTSHFSAEEKTALDQLDRQIAGFQTTTDQKQQTCKAKS